MLERYKLVTKENSAKCVLADGDEDGSCGMLEGETEGLMVVGWGVAATTVLLFFFSFANKFGGGCAGAVVVGEAVVFVVSLNFSGSSISGSGLGCAFFCSCFCNSSQ